MARFLLDTNIILRLAQQKNTQRSEIISALSALDATHHTPCLVPQIFFEYWVVATRPIENNGFGMPPLDAHRSIEFLKKDFVFLPDTANLFDHWLDLVSQYNVKGKEAHDARLVAAMQVHEVTTILTYNIADFQRYTSIHAISPQNYRP